MKMGYCIGVGGVVTFKNAKKLRQTVEQISLEHILLETDCPYMAPEPHRGTRNDSSNLSYVAARIAEIKGVSVQEVEQTTWGKMPAVYSASGRCLPESAEAGIFRGVCPIALRD